MRIVKAIDEIEEMKKKMSAFITVSIGIVLKLDSNDFSSLQ